MRETALHKAWILLRAATYATFFTGVLLVLVPDRLLLSGSIVTPETTGWPQILGIVLAVTGASLGGWCILTFVFVGRGTQAPFDPPRCLVMRGPYRIMRNPMYAGASLALTGASVYYESFGMFAYAAAFWLVAHLVVVFFEEPYLRKSFGRDFEAYSAQTNRWWPKRL